MNSWSDAGGRCSARTDDRLAPCYWRRHRSRRRKPIRRLCRHWTPRTPPRRGRGSAIPAGRRATNPSSIRSRIWLLRRRRRSRAKLPAAITGNAANGAKLVANRKRGGSCLACHVMGPAGGANLPGNVGPDLSEIGNSGLERRAAFQLRLRRARLQRGHGDAALGQPWSVQRPGDHGHRRLPQDAEIAGGVQDCVRRSQQPPAGGKQDNLDPMENPGMWVIEKAEVLWKQRGPTGFSCNTCHNDPAASVQDLGDLHAEMGAPAE